MDGFDPEGEYYGDEEDDTYIVTAVRKHSNIECIKTEANCIEVAVAKVMEYFDDNLVFLVTVEKEVSDDEKDDV